MIEHLVITANTTAASRTMATFANAKLLYSDVRRLVWLITVATAAEREALQALFDAGTPVTHHVKLS